MTPDDKQALLKLAELLERGGICKKFWKEQADLIRSVVKEENLSTTRKNNG